MTVPQSLRKWFIAHAIIDFIFAVPLMIQPALLFYVGWGVVDPIATRLVAAALIGIGGASFLMHKAGKETYNAMLSLKLLWSAAAILGIALSFTRKQPAIVWVFLGIFVAFFLVWAYYKRKLARL